MICENCKKHYDDLNTRIVHKLFNTSILVILVVIFTLFATHTILGEYYPSQDQKPPSGYTDSSGVR
jgi:hypothetical protein